MKSKRKQILISPFVGFNGKLSPLSVVCKNEQDSNATGVKFAYGFQKNNSPSCFFGIRHKSRNLSQNPYSEAEKLARSNFRSFSSFYGLYKANYPMMFVEDYYPELIEQRGNIFDIINQMYLNSNTDLDMRRWFMQKCFEDFKNRDGNPFYWMLENFAPDAYRLAVEYLCDNERWINSRKLAIRRDILQYGVTDVDACIIFSSVITQAYDDWAMWLGHLP